MPTPSTPAALFSALHKNRSRKRFQRTARVSKRTLEQPFDGRLPLWASRFIMKRNVCFLAHHNANYQVGGDFRPIALMRVFLRFVPAVDSFSSTRWRVFCCYLSGKLNRKDAEALRKKSFRIVVKVCHSERSRGIFNVVMRQDSSATLGMTRA